MAISCLIRLGVSGNNFVVGDFNTLRIPSRVSNIDQIILRSVELYIRAEFKFPVPTVRQAISNIGTFILLLLLFICQSQVNIQLSYQDFGVHIWVTELFQVAGYQMICAFKCAAQIRFSGNRNMLPIPICLNNGESWQHEHCLSMMTLLFQVFMKLK